MNDRISSSPPPPELAGEAQGGELLRDSDVAREDELATEPESARAEARSPSFWEFLKATYGSADPRSLALFRVALGVLLFFDVARRFPDVEAHYANTGWLTNHFMLFRPMSSYLFSLYLALNDPVEVKAMMTLQLVVCALFIVGYRTRLMQVLAIVLLVSLNSRNIAVENGGFVVLTLLAVWSAFLPLGRRFSVDAIRRSLRARVDATASALNDRSELRALSLPVVSAALAVLIAQWATIYYFNVVHKTGPEWKNGLAVYYFFQQDRMVTAFGAFIRDYIPVAGFKAMTYGALAIESVVTVLLISPVAPRATRMLAWLLVCLLHLSIDSVVQLGPFSWAMVVMFFALIPSSFWDRVMDRAREKRPLISVQFNPTSGFVIAVCRVLKRLDALERLEFVENAEVRGLAVRRGEQELTGRAALAEATRALPATGFFRAALRLPWLGSALERGLKKPRRATAYFGLGALPGRDEHARPPTPVERFFARLSSRLAHAVLALLVVACTSQVLVENRAVPAWLKPSSRPAWLEAIVVYPRLFQGWSMFAPSPPTDDGRLVIDGVTKDGRRLDPITGQAPDFDLQPKKGFRMNQLWGDFQRRVHEDRFKQYWNGFRDFIRNHHKITGRPEDELAAFDVYFVTEVIPPPGEPRTEARRRKLFSHGDTSRAAKGAAPQPSTGQSKAQQLGKKP